jgi:hypothetical protein
MPATSSGDARHTDDAIRATVIRLCRPDGYGGAVIERAAIVAEGAPAGAIEEWILAHGGEPQAPVVAVRSGLYGLRPAIDRRPAELEQARVVVWGHFASSCGTPVRPVRRWTVRRVLRG